MIIGWPWISSEKKKISPKNTKTDIQGHKLYKTACQMSVSHKCNDLIDEISAWCIVFLISSSPPSLWVSITHPPSGLGRCNVPILQLGPLQRLITYVFWAILRPFLHNVCETCESVLTALTYSIQLKLNKHNNGKSHLSVKLHSMISL